MGKKHKFDGAAILSLPMGENDAGAGTIGEYLVTLVKQVWAEGEGFSGKRPFGNSGWERDLYAPLIRAKLIDGKFDDEGCLERFDENRGADAILAAIEALYPERKQ